MTADEIDLALERWRDGTLPADDGKRIAALLRGDAALHAGIRARLHLAAAIGAELRGDASAIARLSAAMRAGSESSIQRAVAAVRRRLPMRTLAVAAALLAATLLAVGLLMPHGSAAPESADGSRIAQEPGARMDTVDGTRRLLAGRIEASVVPRATPPFTIATAEGSATVLGTRFLLQADPGCTWLGVREGRVRLAGAGGTLEVAAGGVATLGADGVPHASTGWPDHRPIIGWILANVRTPPGNPNGWFDDKDLDIRGPDGRRRFADRLAAEADERLALARRVGAQGILLWDVEGSNPLAPIYPGDPRLVPALAPEMDAAADALFARCAAAGLATGVRIGVFPWRIAADGTHRWAADDGLASAEAAARVAYARARWGCRLFLLAHNLTADGLGRAERGEAIDAERDATPASVVGSLQARFPGCLFLVEHARADTWAQAPALLRPDELAAWRAARARWPSAQAAVLAPADQPPPTDDGLIPLLTR